MELNSINGSRPQWVRWVGTIPTLTVFLLLPKPNLYGNFKGYNSQTDITANLFTQTCFQIFTFYKHISYTEIERNIYNFATPKVSQTKFQIPKFQISNPIPGLGGFIITNKPERCPSPVSAKLCNPMINTTVQYRFQIPIASIHTSNHVYVLLYYNIASTTLINLSQMVPNRPNYGLVWVVAPEYENKNRRWHNLGPD